MRGVVSGSLWVLKPHQRDMTGKVIIHMRIWNELVACSIGKLFILILDCQEYFATRTNTVDMHPCLIDQLSLESNH